MLCFCARSSRVARSCCTKIAPFFGRKPRDFRVEIFENQRDRSRRRTQNADKTLRESFDACIAGRAGFPELCSAFCTEICGKLSRFPLEFAKVSMKFDADFAQHTRPAPAKNAQKSQACVTCCAVHVRCFCARSSRVAHSFCTKIAPFLDRKPPVFALKFLKISAIAAANARRTPTTRSHTHFMHAEPVAQVFLSSAALFAPKSAEKLRDFRLKSRKFR